MKLIISGATGFLATEVIRQSLARPEITSVIALSRRPISTPEGAGASKFKNVVLEDFNHYSEADKKELSGASGCIWTIGLTPSKTLSLTKDDQRRICLDYAVAGITAIHEAGPTKPLRFVYVSGSGISRDPKKWYPVGGDYLRLRGEVERTLVNYAAESNGEIEATVVRPGLISTTEASVSKSGLNVIGALGLISVVSADQVSAAMINQVVNGIEKDPLENKDLVRIGRETLAKWKN